MFHNPLCHAVEVAVSQRSKVSGVRVSDGVEAVGNCGDRVGILVEHTVNSGQHARLCVPRDLDDPLALASLSPDWIKLVFKGPIIIGIILRNYSVQSADGKLRLHSDVLLRMPDRCYVTGTVTVAHLQI